MLIERKILVRKCCLFINRKEMEKKITKKQNGAKKIYIKTYLQDRPRSNILTLQYDYAYN